MFFLIKVLLEAWLQQFCFQGHGGEEPTLEIRKDMGVIAPVSIPLGRYRPHVVAPYRGSLLGH